MSTEILYDEVGATGVRSRVHYDDLDGLMHVEHIGDVEPLVERNKAILNGHAGWASDRTGELSDGSLRMVASLPNVVLVHLWSKGIDPTNLEDERSQRAMRHILNSNEFRHFRVTPGRV